MFLPTDRSVQYPNRYQLAPVAGTDNIADLTPAPGEVGDPGTLWNRQAARQMQADLRTLPIAPGYSVSAGDVVDVSGGQIVKTAAAVANVENVIKTTAITDTAVCYLNSAYSVMVYTISNAVYARLIDNSTGAAVGSEVSVYSGAASNLSLARLSDTQFVVGYVTGSWLRMKIGTVSGTTISFGTEATQGVTDNAIDTLVKLTESLFLAIYTRNSVLIAKPCTVSGTTITLGTEYAPTGTPTAANFSATLLPDDSSGNHRVCVCFSDSGDGNKGKAVIATIDSANQVTWGTVVTFSEANIAYLGCSSSGNSVLVCASSSQTVGYGTVAFCLTASEGSISLSTQLKISATNKIYISVTCIGDGVFVYTGNAQVQVLTVGSELTTGAEFSYNNRSFGNYASISTLSPSSVIVAYADGSNSNYGTTTILEVMGNQIAGSFTDESSTAIALQPGTAGQSIECIFSGTTNAAWATEGQVIDSPGVYGVGIMDGILQVWSKERPGLNIIKGSYVGTGAHGSNNPNTLSFERPVLLLNIGTAENVYRGIFSPPTKAVDTSTSAAATVTWSNNNKTVSWYQANQDIQQLNGNGVTYQYFAICE